VTRAERCIFACLVDHAVAPAPPLPPVAGTDAVAAFARYLKRCPSPNRLALRAALHAVQLAPLLVGERRPLTRLPVARREAVLAGLESGRLALLTSALVALAHLSYYGDDGVMRGLGYDPDAIVARGRELRAAEGRW
jgi:hypothetical protein